MKYSNSEKQKILKKQIKVAAVSEFQSLCKSESCHLFGYLVLFPLDVADEFLNFCNLGIEHLLEELRCQLLGDGKFIGSFDGLVEVAAKPAEVLLVLAVKDGHLVQCGDTALCGGVVELSDGIPDHCAHRPVAGGFPLE